MVNRSIIFLVWIVANSSFVWAAPGASEVRAGNAAYQKQDYSQAIEKYEAAARKAPTDVRVDYDLGAAAYKLGKYKDSVGFFNKALLSEDAQVVGSAHYNLGNGLYKFGIETEDVDIEGAVKSLEESLSHYDKGLVLNEKDEDAKSNRAFVAGELERLKKKAQEQKQHQQKQCPNPKPKDKGEPSKDQQKQEQKDQQKQQQEQSKDQPQDENADEKEGEQPKPPPQKKNDEKKEERQSGEESKDDKAGDKDPQKDASAGQEETGHLLSQEEANILLDNFAQNEQPKGMLKLDHEPRQEKPVLKDW